jgi:uncharacterized phage-associated protein
VFCPKGDVMPMMYDAKSIARYFLAKSDESAGDLLSNLKLQKLLYYAQGVGIATRQQPLFGDALEAWTHGPVVPGIYHAYKANGASGIPPINNLDLEGYEPADRMILDDVYDYYGQFSAWRLRDMTHEEAPWKEAYERDEKIITHEALMAFFLTQIDGQYRERYGRLSGKQG